jgi:hypothetical protein
MPRIKRIKPLIIGFKNELSEDPADAMEPWTPNGAGERLYMMVNSCKRMSKNTFMEKVEFVNAAQLGEKATRRLMRDRPSIVLGLDAWNLLKLKRASFWIDCRSGAWLVPHPSGRNMIYNSVEARKATGRLILRMLPP